MTTQKQIEANRRNARNSTGPRSREGKARSALNAMTHGLNQRPDAKLIKAWYTEILGEDLAPEVGVHLSRRQEAAMQLAKAEVLLSRARKASEQHILDPNEGNGANEVLRFITWNIENLRCSEPDLSKHTYSRIKSRIEREIACQQAWIDRNKSAQAAARLVALCVSK